MVDQSVHLWLRAETKKNEARVALTPDVCKQLLDSKKFKITVEKCSDRIFNNAEYEKLGCQMVEKGTWKQAPKSAIIIGLKELPENETDPLGHSHIFFAHCYKKQDGWKEILARFNTGGGKILDLEFLTDEKGRRVAAFGYHAGFAGTAIGLDVWCRQQLANPMSRIGSGAMEPIKPYPNESELLTYMKSRLEAAKKQTGRLPKVLVIGALGRCGTGACDFAKRAGIPDENIVRWDMAETARGGPFSEILDADVFVNCIYLSKPIPPFLTKDLMFGSSGRKLSVVVDVSCDTTNPHNPIPIYNQLTTFDKPVLAVKNEKNPSDVVEVVAIDHLPTLLPRESSMQFGKDLLPSLLQLADYENARVWKDAEKLFHAKVEEMKQQSL